MGKKNDVKRLCIQCKNIYTIKSGYDYMIGLVLTVASSIVFAQALLKGDTGMLSSIPSLLLIGGMFAVGVFLLLNHKKKQENCPVCDTEKTLIKLGTPVAIEIIKENNLSVPE